MSLAGVVVATLIALLGPIPAAALAPGATGLIAFVSSRDNQGDGYDIYVMNADGTNPTRLTTDGSDQPVISPDGQHIAYRCPRHGNYEICLMNADGTNQVDLTNNPAADAEPAFSPDGTHIAFSSQGRDSTISGADIFVMNADGTNQTPLTTDGGDHPVYSPDGQQIAFECSRNNNFEICLMNADGSNQIDLTDNPAYDAQPFWGALAAQTATTTTLDVAPASPAAANTIQMLKATVTPPAAAGSVQFRDGTSTIGNPVTVTNGTATRSTTLLPGTHHLSAVFTSTDPTRFSPSTSTEVSYVVETATAAASTTTLAAFPTFAFQGLPIVFVAQVAPPAAAGTVQIMDGTTPLGAPVPMFAGFALLVRTLPPGMHTLTAAFTPTNPGAIAPSTSAPVSLTVAGFG